MYGKPKEEILNPRKIYFSVFLDRVVLFSHDRIPCGAVLFIFSYGFVVILVYIYAIRVGVGITPEI